MELLSSEFKDLTYDFCLHLDFDESILSVVEANQPSYLFYRLDSKNNQGYEWIFIAYSPDESKVFIYRMSFFHKIIKLLFTDICDNLMQSIQYW